MSRYFSIILCTAVGLLAGLGLVMLTSTSVWVRGVESPYYFLSRQSFMLCLGLVLAVAASMMPQSLFRKFAGAAFFITIALLILCFIPPVAAPSLGSNRWIHVPVINSFQPSEMARIVVIVCLAAWFARWQTEVGTLWKGFVIPGVIAGLPIGLIAIETDVGTALSISVAVAAVMFCVGSRLRYMLPVAIAGAAGAVWFVCNDKNRWSRIEAWLDLENPVHQLGFGMQQWRALLALGSGGPTGVGLGNGSEKFGTLTYSHIDFIFPNIGQELGLTATLGVVLCFVLIAVSGIGIAMQARDVFNRCLALGLTCMIVVPGMVNIAVTTAVLPNDGLPLPFVSFGGTSLVFSLVAVGMLVGIHRRSRQAIPGSFPLSRETRFAVRL
ncbi:MAG: FtsW/RodA/SpoVE family cell cycle protein [Verrucomicrobiota bacterium]